MKLNFTFRTIKFYFILVFVLLISIPFYILMVLSKLILLVISFCLKPLNEIIHEKYMKFIIKY